MILTTKDESTLGMWRDKICNADIAVSGFIEPHYGDSLTAICAIDPDGTLEEMLELLPLA